MKNTLLSTTLSKKANKSLSEWERLILKAKQRVVEMKRAIRTFEDLRDSGMELPTPTFESESEVLGQDEVLGQSPGFQLCLISRV